MESGIPLTMEPGIQVTLKKNGVEYLESGIHGLESRIQNPEFPYMVRGGGGGGREHAVYEYNRFAFFASDCQLTG